MLTYRIPQRKVQVVVHLTKGDPLLGKLFVPVEGPGGKPVRLSDRLAEPGDRFLALVQEDNSRLISRHLIVRVELLAEEDAEFETEPGTGEPVLVACRLADGSVVEGTVSFAMPPGRERLIDYLNSRPDGFVPLRAGKMLSLIHLRQVVDWATR
jgi:hypothetical protein